MRGAGYHATADGPRTAWGTGCRKPCLSGISGRSDSDGPHGMPRAYSPKTQSARFRPARLRRTALRRSRIRRGAVLAAQLLHDQPFRLSPVRSRSPYRPLTPLPRQPAAAAAILAPPRRQTAGAPRERRTAFSGEYARLPCSAHVPCIGNPGRQGCVQLVFHAVRSICRSVIPCAAHGLKPRVRLAPVTRTPCTASQQPQPPDHSPPSSLRCVYLPADHADHRQFVAQKRRQLQVCAQNAYLAPRHLTRRMLSSYSCMPDGSHDRGYLRGFSTRGRFGWGPPWVRRISLSSSISRHLHITFYLLVAWSITVYIMYSVQTFCFSYTVRVTLPNVLIAGSLPRFCASCLPRLVSRTFLLLRSFTALFPFSFSGLLVRCDTLMTVAAAGRNRSKLIYSLPPEECACSGARTHRRVVSSRPHMRCSPKSVLSREAAGARKPFRNCMIRASSDW